MRRSWKVLQIARPQIVDKLRLSRCSSTPKKDEMLRKMSLTFDPTGGAAPGHERTVEAVYQDTAPSGSSIGTVVATHGSPGSHKDWKYITPRLAEKGIRMIGINFPGFGFTQDLPDLTHDNVERTAFIQALIDKLGLTERIIFIGHSRGAENALKMAAMNKDRTVAAIMLNCPGLRIHRGIRPFGVIALIRSLHNNHRWTRAPLERIMYWYYNRIGLKLYEGRIAINSVKTMYTTSLEKQKPILDEIVRDGRIRLMLGYSGNDFLIETEISREFASHFPDRQHIDCHTADKTEEDRVIEELRQAFGPSGRRSVSIEFSPDNHFLQKHRARVFAAGIEQLFESAGKGYGSRL